MLEPVHFSTLKHIQRSPAHYRYEADNRREKQEAFELGGSALHSFLLGGKEVVRYEARRVGKEWQAFREAHPNCIILNAKEHDKAAGMRDSIERHQQATELLQGTRERTMQWRWLGRLIEGTQDVFTLEHLTELKTGRTTHPERFMSAAKFYGYHAQLAWYRRGLIESGFGTPASAWIVAVESAPPFPVTVFRMTDNALELGERMCRAWLERLLVCEESDQWPAYAESPVPFDIQEDGGFTLTIDGEEVEVE